MSGTVLITGAQRGLGLAHLERYVRRGWEVLACTRPGHRGDALQSLGDRHLDRRGQVVPW